MCRTPMSMYLTPDGRQKNTCQTPGVGRHYFKLDHTAKLKRLYADVAPAAAHAIACVGGAARAATGHGRRHQSRARMIDPRWVCLPDLTDGGSTTVIASRSSHRISRRRPPLRSRGACRRLGSGPPASPTVGPGANGAVCHRRRRRGTRRHRRPAILSRVMEFPLRGRESAGGAQSAR